MDIIYIAHSGFMVDLPDRYILFDYYKGAFPTLTSSKPLYIFSSHDHKDHFNPKIFSLGEEHKNTKYFLSDDIVLSEDIKKKYIKNEDTLNSITYVEADKEYHVCDNFSISTLRSTDIGVAFVVSCGKYNIYHAGDLNMWLWGNEDTKEEADEMKQNFISQIDKLIGKSIDIAFLPLDPRQTKEQYLLGFDYFTRTVDPKFIFPMHFWGKYKFLDKFMSEPLIQGYSNKIIKIEKGKSTYSIDI